MARESLSILKMKVLLGLLFSIISITVLYSQDLKQKREKGLQFNVQGIAMAVGNTGEVDNMPEDLIMHIRNSQLFGVNLEAHYRFDEYWIVGLGTGYEYVNQPAILYFPVYLSLRSSIGGDKLEATIFRLDFGTHFGDLAKNGVLLRAGIGYRIPVFKKLCLNIDAVVSYQGLRKEFDLQPGVIQYYNMFGFGIGVGFEL